LVRRPLSKWPLQGIWSYRNKAGFLLLQLTRSRDPELLERLRAQALDALIEMARWRDTSRAVWARMILGRIGGIPEDRPREAAWGPVEVILDSVAK
jgi:hypothetical protein